MAMEGRIAIVHLICSPYSAAADSGDRVGAYAVRCRSFDVPSCGSALSTHAYHGPVRTDGIYLRSGQSSPTVELPMHCRVPSMADAILRVLSRCTPAQIVGHVVSRVAIEMTDLGATDRPRSVECEAHQSMDASRSMPAGGAQTNSRIGAVVRNSEDEANATAGATFGSLHTASVANHVRRPPGNRSPLLRVAHEEHCSAWRLSLSTKPEYDSELVWLWNEGPRA
jgi:hypothetical protein